MIQPLPKVVEPKKPMGLPKPGIATKTTHPAELLKGGHLADFAFETSSCFERKIQVLQRHHFQYLTRRREAAQRLTAFVRAKMEPILKPRVLAEFPSSGSAVVLVKGIKPIIGFDPKPRPSDSSRSSSEGSYPDFRC